MTNWQVWSEKPFLITEWYTKSEGWGLTNNTGAGWNVPTQTDCGCFDQNFTTELLRSMACVGWHWVACQDNDPADLSTNTSNRGSNKGLVDSRFRPCAPLFGNMKQLNDHVYELERAFRQTQQLNSSQGE